MSADTEPKARDLAPGHVVPRRKELGRAPDCVPSFGRVRRIPVVSGWRSLVLCLLLAATTISFSSADASTDQVLLPIEVLGADGTTISRTVTLNAGQAESVRSLWLQIHGLRYPDEASVQVNTGAWMTLNNDTVTVAEPGRSYGGIGGGFSTLVVTLPLPNGTVLVGGNAIRFRFNHTDGLVSGFRVLAWNFLTAEGTKILPPEDFREDAPETWTAPLPDTASIQTGRELWNTASLVASSLPNSPTIQAHCADCHARDGRDLKYFNFSNNSIVSRSRFHGLSTHQGEQIASYIRSLTLPNPGRPWNPPYQPGPGLDQQPIERWAAGAGLAWVLDRDTDALPYLVGGQGVRTSDAASNRTENVHNLGELLGQITPDVFRPDGNLNPRQVPIALQLPDWNRWLPHVHPKDAWGPAFVESEFAALYDSELTSESKSNLGARPPLRTLLLEVEAGDRDIRHVVAVFAQWAQDRRALLRRVVKAKTAWSPALTDKVYSTQLWQLVKTWEMMQEFGLEGRGRDFFAATADSRTWFNTVLAETAPSSAHIPDGPAGVGGSALTNQYFTSSWYELQIILNSGNHQHRDRGPVDWVYVVDRFRDLFTHTHQPEPTRVLVAVTKALQSADPRIGPDDYRRGWRPDQNIDPRIMVSPLWTPIFGSLPREVHQALTTSLLTAWMDKNAQYTMGTHLPMGLLKQSYTSTRRYGEISGGKVWEAAPQFLDAGVPPELIERLLDWGTAFTDRAARIQYERYRNPRRQKARVGRIRT